MKKRIETLVSSALKMKYLFRTCYTNVNEIQKDI